MAIPNLPIKTVCSGCGNPEIRQVCTRCGFAYCLAYIPLRGQACPHNPIPAVPANERKENMETLEQMAERHRTEMAELRAKLDGVGKCYLDVSSGNLYLRLAGGTCLFVGPDTGFGVKLIGRMAGGTFTNPNLYSEISYEGFLAEYRGIVIELNSLVESVRGK